MRITKLGHCCLVVEEGSARILTDPGDYTAAQIDARGLTAILITHEHSDHLHVPSLRTVLANNPGVVVYTNRGVGEILEREGIAFSLLEHGHKTVVGGVKVEGYGEKHAFIYAGVKDVMNTGYFLADKFFYPGDAFCNPGRPVGLLALPVSAPWLKLAEALDYAKLVKPQRCFPVHDGALKIFGAPHKLPAKELPAHGIAFSVPELGVPFEV